MRVISAPVSIGHAADEAATRAWEARLAELREVCDVLRPWSHGLIARSSARPEAYDFNVVIVERDPELGHDELIAFADRALSGLSHRRIDFAQLEDGSGYRAGFERRGWQTSCLVRMRHEGELPEPEVGEVEEVGYDEVSDLRVRWHQEDFPGIDANDFFRTSRELALSRGARVLAVHRDGTAVGFAQVEPRGDGAELSDVYVTPEHRGQGMGTTLTSAAAHAAAPAREIWITADGEGRPQRLYARLGFRPVHREIRFLRLPGAA